METSDSDFVCVFGSIGKLRRIEQKDYKNRKIIKIKHGQKGL
jgi:hypothetical protein